MVQAFDKWIVDLDDLRDRDEPLRVTGELTDRQLGLHNLVNFLEAPLHTQMVVALDEPRLRIKGGISVHLGLSCCRCLQDFRREIKKDFDVEYWPDPEVEEGDELELTYQDLDVGFYRSNKIDLSGVVVEQVILELPMKPVCREDCKGLCDQCGANLNEGSCSCDKTHVDPRFSVLVELKKRMDH